MRPLIAYTQPFVNAIEGESAELECVVLLGKPAPKLTWLRKGEVLRESSSVYFTEPGRVVISGVKKSDEGDYICLASNIGGNESYAINLDVLGKKNICMAFLAEKNCAYYKSHNVGTMLLYSRYLSK